MIYAIIGSVVGIITLLITLGKIMFSMGKLTGKIDELAGDMKEVKGKVDNHNHLIERIVALEQANKDLLGRVDKVSSRLDNFIINAKGD
ncbi:MAG: hypothetical protein LBV16_02475 [Elusimicrobiota bacterium]|jgi:hypothetical protein|nr:hypothetical protein [Elusimicrobiota bacterium]